MKTRPPWLDLVARFLSRNVQPSERLLLAVSGGADSIVMTAVLADDLAVPTALLVCGHVNHGIRQTGSLDYDVVRETASCRGIHVTHRTVDTRSYAKQAKLSIEAAARSLRYTALREMAVENNCRWILTAHTMDDSAETVLMRLRSGAPWYECTAIPSKRGAILRPFLETQRIELRDYLRERKLKFRDDETNSDLRFARNRLRSELTGRTEAWTNSIVRGLHKQGNCLSEGLRGLWLLARLHVNACNIDGSKTAIGLEIDEIFRYFTNLAFLPVETAWASHSGNADRRLPSSMRRQIQDCLGGNSPHARLFLPHNIEMRKCGSRVWIFRTPSAPVDMPITLGDNVIPERRAALVLQSFADSAFLPENAIRVSGSVLRRTLSLRSWRPGDHIKPLGRPRKKVADILNERRANPLEKDEALVITDCEGPIMMIGGPIDERVLAQSDEREIAVITWTEND